jgi:hypothetical protein
MHVRVINLYALNTLPDNIYIFFFISKKFYSKKKVCISMHSKLGYNYKSEQSEAKEAKNSPTEGEEVRPQALDQSYKEPKNNSYDFSQRNLLVLESATISLPPNSPHKA